MLFEFKETRSGSPVEPGYISHLVIVDESERKEDVHKAWDEVIERMIFLFGESDEQTCSRENPFEEKYFKAFDDVQNRNREEDNDKGGHRLHFPDEYPEYKTLADNYREEEKKLAENRLQCKNEAFELFCEWFYDLWD